ncbi:MAG TPA: DM13 domain-containing protein [Gaiellaceae bacterium]|nr:DM13 domain-containing protein [Gaiellaceae bacterium]
MSTAPLSLRHGGWRAPLALRLLAVPVTVALVLAGVWVTGGLVTNDFALAMWLSAGWMALAGLLALVVALRSRAFRWPVLGAYAVTAAVLGVYLGSSVFMDDVVDERVAVAAPAPAGGATTEPGRAESRNVLVAAGRFRSVRHEAAGKAQAIRLAEGGRVLTLTEFEVDNGPDLRVYLAAGAARAEAEVDDFVDLGALKGNVGNQQYELPASVDLDRYSTVVIWCRAFSVLFARAPLRP